MEPVVFLGNFFKETSFLDTFLFIIIIIISGTAYKYVPHLIKMNEIKNENKIKLERERQKSLDTQNVLLANNNTIVTSLKESLNMLSISFNKISDKFSSHDASSDERSIRIIAALDAQAIILNGVAEKIATKDNLERLHNRLDIMTKTLADKNDVTKICDAINKIDKELNKANERIIELKSNLRK